MNKLYNFLFSTRLTAVLFVLFAAAMGTATFIENDYGTQTAKALIYSTWWFEVIMLIFILNFIGNIFKYKLLRKEKLSILVFHLSFILIILGAGITRYISFEGTMPILEGESTNVMLSEKTFFSVVVDDGTSQREPIEKTYLFAKEPSSDFHFIPLISHLLNMVRGGNSFTIHSGFKEKPFTVKYVNYIANAYQKFVKDDEGEELLHFVESGGGGRHDHYIKKGELVNIHNILVSYEKQTQGAINIFTKNDTLVITSPFKGNYMVMASQEKGTLAKDSIQKFKLRSLYTLGSMRFVVPEAATKGKLIIVSGKKEEHIEDLLKVEVSTSNEKKIIQLYGTKFRINPPTKFSLEGLNFRLSYGSKQLELPFSIKLRDFQLDRYAGSMSPKSFASEITVLDKGANFDYRIFMNHVLDHKGYRFFQSSYDDSGPVEETRLAVNHDSVGTWITYVGYGLLYLGLLLSLMVKNTRFSFLRKQLKKIETKKATLTILVLLFSILSNAQDNHNHRLTNTQIDSILNTQKVAKEHAENFGKLIIQDEGRMKPVNTFVSQLLRKVSKRDNYNGMDANQVAISIVTNPRIWYEVPFIFIKPENTKVRAFIGIPNTQKYVRLSDLFDSTGDYKLHDEIAKAHKKRIKTKYEQSVIAVDERANLLFQAISGSIFKFFPLQDDSNNKWYSYTEQSTIFKGKDSLNAAYMLPLYSDALYKGLKDNNYKKADEYLKMIHNYQHKVGSAVMPSERKIELELYYNKHDIFKNLFWQYMLASLFLLTLVIIQIFKNSRILEIIIKIASILIIVLFVYHTTGLGILWYISGHAPWSNGYESMIYVSWATMLFGLVLGRKSTLTFAATTFVTSIILMIAHWNWLDPTISNLQPVLNSYWLKVHVAIIVASYGPFTLSLVLGTLALLIYIFTTESNKKKLALVAKEITTINEMSMTIGLVMLTIGNFLGGMWANESWGRYWGWDPKETWALVSIMVYAFILHTRLVPGLRSKLAFNILAVLSFASILMTFLGVNHLLSGLHSYAAGDSVPIPNQIWAWLFISVVISILAAIKYRKYYKKS